MGPEAFILFCGFQMTWLATCVCCLFCCFHLCTCSSFVQIRNTCCMQPLAQRACPRSAALAAHRGFIRELHFLFIHVKRSRLTMLVWRLTNAAKMRMRASLRVGKETSSRGLDSMWTRQRRSVHLLLSGSYLNSKAFCSTGFPPPGCQRDSNQHLAHAQYLALVS